MRTILFACSLFISSFFYANQQQNADPYSLALVKRALTNNTLGIDFGADDKQIPRLGDLCAIAILKIVDEPNLTEPDTVRGILRTIRSAFASPKSILITEDRKPRVTMFLLNNLQKNVRSAELKQEVLRTTEFVKRQTALRTAANALPDE